MSEMMHIDANGRRRQGKPGESRALEYDNRHARRATRPRARPSGLGRPRRHVQPQGMKRRGSEGQRLATPERIRHHARHEAPCRSRRVASADRCGPGAKASAAGTCERVGRRDETSSNEQIHVLQPGSPEAHLRSPDARSHPAITSRSCSRPSRPSRSAASACSARSRISGCGATLWRDWFTSIDHKKIGIMYIILGLVMLLRGFADAMMMRAQQAIAFGGSRGLPAAAPLRPDLHRPRRDHDLLRGDAAGDGPHELRRAAADRRARRRLPVPQQLQLLDDGRRRRAGDDLAVRRRVRQHRLARLSAAVGHR